jgi:C1A family cysteine protease
MAGVSNGDREFQAIQDAIDKSQESWQAAETDLSRLSDEERKKRLGLRARPEALLATQQFVHAAETLVSFTASPTAPSYVDWRQNGGNFVTPIKNRSNCGSCVAFATIATIESRVSIRCSTLGQNRDYSEAHLFYCGCGACCSTGWNFDPRAATCRAPQSNRPPQSLAARRRDRPAGRRRPRGSPSLPI